MSNQKQFGIWMDNHQATIVGNDNIEGAQLRVIANVEGGVAAPNSSEKNSNHAEKTEHLKFFKEISSHLTNATRVHVTGTGQAQEQFIHFMAATPQFKNCNTDESTSNKMSDEKLIEFVTAKV